MKKTNAPETRLRLLVDCPATLIPDGYEIVLPKGAAVHVTQALGGAVTVKAERGLCRIPAFHVAEALGAEWAEALTETAPPAVPGGFSEERVWEALRKCYDPEIPVNIVDLGLVYDIAIRQLSNGLHRVTVRMTLTAPGCGMGPSIAGDAKARIENLPGVESAEVEIVWDPQWTPQMISDAGRKILGLD